MKLTTLTLSFALMTSLATATNFPYRKDYSEVPPISTERLARQQNDGKAIIIDVRSQIEFDVIHPIGSLHLPISDDAFVAKITELRRNNADKALAFYCNGITCLKSYEAARKAIAAGLGNCFVYDAGIPEWAETLPERTLLLGKVLEDPERQLIPKAKFKERCLEFSTFKQKAGSGHCMAVDVRDTIQKSGKLPALWNAAPIPLDKFIPNFVQKKMHQDETLLIFDQVGKQVRWLEYYLVENGYTDYYFLKGGATAILKKQEYK